jgi:hypothetical protein
MTDTSHLARPFPEIVKPQDDWTVKRGSGGFDPYSHTVSVSHSQIKCNTCGINHNDDMRTEALIAARITDDSEMPKDYDPFLADAMSRYMARVEANRNESLPDVQQSHCTLVTQSSLKAAIHGLQTRDLVRHIINSTKNWDDLRTQVKPLYDVAQEPLETALVQAVHNVLYDFFGYHVFDEHDRIHHAGAGLDDAYRNLPRNLRKLEEYIKDIDDKLQQEAEQEAERERTEGMGDPVDAGRPHEERPRDERMIDEADRQSENTDLSADKNYEEIEHNEVSPAEMAKFGDLEIVRPDLPILLHGKDLSRVWRSAEVGDSIRRPHRWVTDKRIFGRKTKDKGGTLLIDASGSMGISRDDIEMMCHLIPAGTIATYAGEGKVGELHIIAKKGRMVNEHTDIRPEYGGNIVDGPALEWLGKQQRPRIWVSDGGVSFEHDIFDDRAKSICRRLVRRYAIHRIENHQARNESFLRRFLKIVR